MAKRSAASVDPAELATYETNLGGHYDDATRDAELKLRDYLAAVDRMVKQKAGADPLAEAMVAALREYDRASDARPANHRTVAARDTALVEYNPYHAADGKFTTAQGVGGGGSVVRPGHAGPRGAFVGKADRVYPSRKALNRQAAEAARLTMEYGGSSLRPTADGKGFEAPPPGRSMVGIPGKGTTFPVQIGPDGRPTNAGREAFREQYREFAERHRDLLAARKDVYIGTWIDTKSGAGYLDVSQAIKGLNTGFLASQLRGELALWRTSADGGREVRTMSDNPQRQAAYAARAARILASIVATVRPRSPAAEAAADAARREARIRGIMDDVISGRQRNRRTDQ